MSEVKIFSSQTVIQDGKDREWVLLSKSDSHELYRTPSGAWIVVPTEVERFSDLYTGQLIRALRLDIDVLIKQADSLISKGSRIHTASLVLMVSGLVLMGITFGRALISPSNGSISGAWVVGLLILTAGLCPAAIWLGKNVIGPRVMKSPPVSDNPFQVVEFRSKETDSD